ncbi:hypothetical protein ColTof3_13108 [Colletotrichum tofieldiae]|nr:hypothetical protein ColTof3_13108 [Colletotrichum tofieldiae]
MTRTEMNTARHARHRRGSRGANQRGQNSQNQRINQRQRPTPSLYRTIRGIPGLKFYGGDDDPTVSRRTAPALKDLLTDTNDEPRKMTELDHRLTAARRARVILEAVVHIAEHSTGWSYKNIWKDAMDELRLHRSSWQMRHDPRRVAEIIASLSRARVAYQRHRPTISQAPSSPIQGFQLFLEALDRWLVVKNAAKLALTKISPVADGRGTRPVIKQESDEDWEHEPKVERSFLSAKSALSNYSSGTTLVSELNQSSGEYQTSFRGSRPSKSSTHYRFRSQSPYVSES